MPTITFKPSNITIDVPTGTSLPEAARLAGLEIESPCGENGTCGNCVVRIVAGEVDSDSLGLLSPRAVKDGYALACKTRVSESPLTIEVPEQIDYEGGKFIDTYEDTSLLHYELFPENYQFDPLSVKCFLTVSKPQLEDGLSDVDRITRSLELNFGKIQFTYALSVIRKAADALRAEDGKVTVTLIKEPNRCHVIDIEPADHTTKHFGIAVDVGTTTVAVQLIALPGAEILSTRTDYNEQIRCGLDVISRINYARQAVHLDELRECVLNTINRLITLATESHNVKHDNIYSAVISGNTTMVHLLLGLKPEYIRLEPYSPTVHKTPFFTAEEIGLDIHPQAAIYISPGIGSYVGGDITSGILCTDLVADSEEIKLFLDIGTNGELVIGNGSFLMACACSAGPAFEGGGIEHGMRAAIGAIERVEIDAETGAPSYFTIGNVPPKAVCGSGMISLLANLFLTGWIDAAGKLNRTKNSPFIQINGRHAQFIIVPAEESGTGKAIVIGEVDIANIIRAKAAIYSACSLMLARLGLEFADITKVYIAGGFGRFLDLDKARIIGMIPDLPREKFKYIGNSSLKGAYMVLVSQEHRQQQIESARRMTYMELNTDPSYMDQYTGALFLPHTDPERFSSVHAAMRIKNNNRLQKKRRID